MRHLGVCHFQWAKEHIRFRYIISVRERTPGVRLELCLFTHQRFTRFPVAPQRLFEVSKQFASLGRKRPQLFNNTPPCGTRRCLQYQTDLLKYISLLFQSGLSGGRQQDQR